MRSAGTEEGDGRRGRTAYSVEVCRLDLHHLIVQCFSISNVRTAGTLNGTQGTLGNASTTQNFGVTLVHEI